MRIEISVEKSSGDSAGKIWELSVFSQEATVIRVAREIVRFFLKQLKKEEAERMREKSSGMIADEFKEERKFWEER